MKLESNRSAITEIGIAVSMSVLFMMVTINEYGLLLSIVISLFLSVVPTLCYWLIYGNKPAAWIKDDILYIKSWPLNVSKICKSYLEYILNITPAMKFLMVDLDRAYAIY